ncbi:ABC transporter ATP-binding protein [Aerococcus agrisoli]|uniref:ABC transporter ATP-binding protein n=1 Tax=Aerococcus agrisoli TaxID=2487350 RepID=A0A3N4GE04_9LACT|nr:ABC transporter ATP-binding protein [Aerococcus agrisoli]RPA56840.1 ABC transporter ATP-binding protein [Aerococcus agrisoli]
MNNTLKVENLTKIYQSKGKTFEAVKDINFTINDGEIVALIGPNGAGKTTIVSMIGGYILPTAGNIFINGKLNNRHNVGISFGGDLGFYGRVSAEDNLKFYADLANIPYKDRQSEVSRVLKMVNLDGNRKQLVQEFSKGMNQRLHIAKALLGHPKLLLFDEPTNGVDVEMAAQIRQTIKELTKKEGVAILLTSHIMGEIESLADRILLIGDGSIRFSGSISELIDKSGVTHIDRQATLEESYLAIAPSLRRK